MRRVLASAVAALALLACSDSSVDDGGATDADADTTTTTTTAGDAPDVQDPPALELLDAGSEPRAELRYALVAGATGRYETTTVVDQQVDEVSPGAITTTVEIATEVLSASADEATFTATYGTPVVETAPGTPAEVAAAAEQGAGFLAGAVAKISVDPRGDVLDLELQLADEAGSSGEQLLDTLIDSILDSLAQQSVVLPDEPVGIGAQWRVDFSIESAGVTSAIAQTFTLVGFDTSGADLEYTLTGTFEEAATGTTSGSGTMRVSFDSFFPEITATSVNEISTQGSTILQTIDQTIRRL